MPDVCLAAAGIDGPISYCLLMELVCVNHQAHPGKLYTRTNQRVRCHFYAEQAEKATAELAARGDPGIRHDGWIWAEHRVADGFHDYWYNKDLAQTVWYEPPVTRCIAPCARPAYVVAAADSAPPQQINSLVTLARLYDGIVLRLQDLEKSGELGGPDAEQLVCSGLQLLGGRYFDMLKAGIRTSATQVAAPPLINTDAGTVYDTAAKAYLIIPGQGDQAFLSTVAGKNEVRSYDGAGEVEVPAGLAQLLRPCCRRAECSWLTASAAANSCSPTPST